MLMKEKYSYTEEKKLFVCIFNRKAREEVQIPYEENCKIVIIIKQSNST